MKDVHCKQLLKIIRYFNTENERNVIFALALHGIFLPTLRGSNTGEAYRPTIIDSQNSFIQLTTASDIDKAIQQRKNLCISQNIEHPFIIGVCVCKEEDRYAPNKKMRIPIKFTVGIENVSQIEKFKVVFGASQFEYENFVTAVDICFKIYKTLNIQYPESKHVWTFLDQAFFKVSSDTTSKISDVLNKLK